MSHGFTKTVAQDAWFVLSKKRSLINTGEQIPPHQAVELMPGMLLQVPIGTEWHYCHGERWIPKTVTADDIKISPLDKLSRDEGLWSTILLGPYDAATVQKGLWIAQGSLSQSVEDWKMKLQACGKLKRVNLKREYIKCFTEFSDIVLAETCLCILENGLYEIAPVMNVQE